MLSFHHGPWRFKGEEEETALSALSGWTMGPSFSIGREVKKDLPPSIIGGEREGRNR